MKLPEELKTRGIKLLKGQFTVNDHHILILAIIAGFAVANMRQQSRLSLVNNGEVIVWRSEDSYDFEPTDENLCGGIFRKYADENMKYYIKTGRITKDNLNKEIERLENSPSLFEEFEFTEIWDLDKEEKEPAVERFIKACETTLAKNAKKGFWPTVVIYSIFGWFGLTMVSRRHDPS